MRYAVLASLALLLPVYPSTRLVSQAVPSPASVIGFEPGTDSMLADWGQITGYLSRLSQTSRLVRIDTLGRTSMGKPLVLVTITAPENQGRVHEIKRNQSLLADPRRLSPAAYDELRKTQPVVVLINNNIHATEIASSQMGMTLAYRLATEPGFTHLLDSMVVLMIPSMNPDGLDTTVAWYRKYKGTRYEAGPMPWLYHKYVGHDNNRDWFMITQVETQHVTRMLYREWFPEVVWDVHQMGSNGARLFVPPFRDPVNPNLDPSLVSGMNLLGATMAAALYDAGLTGVSHQVSYDLWWHGGFRSVPTRHNMVGILSEAASARYASPITIEPSALRQPERGVNFPAPWPGGVWRLGDIVRYELVAAEALLRLAATSRVQFLDRFVTLGRRAVAAGEAGRPFAYLLPPGARDEASRVLLANTLIAGGVEVSRAEAAFTADGRQYPAGTLVVPMAQPFRAHAKDLLEPQRFPSGTRPYDVAGWTLPYTMDVPAIAVDAPFTATLVRVDSVVVTPGRVTGSGSTFVLANRTNGESSAIAELLGAGQSVTVSGDSVLVQGPRARQILSARATRHGFSVRAARGSRLPAGPGVVTRRRLPRIALYAPWTASMDEGWTRWVFEQHGITYTTVHDSDLRGDLRGRFDVIILPDESGERILSGIDSTRIPAPYAGGMGELGAEAVSAFVRGGGTLICLDGSSSFAISRLNLPVVNVLAGQASGPEVSLFYAPGSIFGVVLGGGSPVVSGLRDSLKIYFDQSAAFEVQAPARALATYPEAPLRSGYVQHAERIVGKAALVEVPVEKGRVILFGFRPQFRGQTHGTFKLLFNAVLLAAP